MKNSTRFFALALAFTVLPLAANATRDPNDGIFLDRDSLRADGLNLYAYCNNDPINLTDPLGLAPKDNTSRIASFDGGGLGNLVPGEAPPGPGGMYRPLPQQPPSSSSCPANGPGLERNGFRPAPGTRVPPGGIPDSWRIGGTRTPGGVNYYDPQNPGNSVRVMPGDPNSPFPNSQNPYARWQQDGRPLDMNGSPLPTSHSPDAHIPLNDFQFDPALFP